MQRQRVVQLLRAEAARRQAIGMLDSREHLPEHLEVAAALEEAANLLQKEKTHAIGRKGKNKTNCGRWRRHP